jgi:hypothetical protein
VINLYTTFIYKISRSKFIFQISYFYDYLINVLQIRSAAHFHTRNYKDCMKDLDRALDSGYPKPELLYRLHLRKAQCLKFLKMDYNDCLTEAMKVILRHARDFDY